MNIIKKIVTFRPSFALRIILGMAAVVVFLSTCAIVGISDVTSGLAARDARYNARLIEQGAQVYYEQCARCHGPDGKGVDGQGPALSSLNFLGTATQKSQRLQDIGWTGTLAGYISAVTAAGIPLKSSNQWDVVHPAFSQAYGGNLRDDQIANVTLFILNWQQQPYTTGVIDSPKPGEGFIPKATTVPLTPEQEAGKQVFLKEGCIACHTIKGVSTGSVGPALTTIGTDAAAVLQSAAYKSSKGTATTPEGFIHESIVDPNVYIAPQCPNGPCPANVMPQNFKDVISATDLANLVAYLASLK